MKLLVIEDNIPLVNSLKDYLGNHFHIQARHSGTEGAYEAITESYDAIILDLGLPDKSGLEVCAEIRAANVLTPILVLTGTDNAAEKVHLLDSGADDYVTKPFNATELRARLHAILRRTSNSSERTNIITIKGVAIDVTNRTVTYGNTSIDLRRKEFDVLEYLVRNRGRVLTRAMIFNHISEIGKDNWSNVIDVYIKNLRDKIERPLGTRLIETVHGVGYTVKP
jgi:DNA-binding response OmpR family regulator